jgi:hypothetical protein
MVLPLTAGIIAIFAWLVSHSLEESWVIALFATGGYFFAQANVLTTLLILQQRIRWCISPPLTGFLGILCGVWFAESVFQFTLFLLCGRLIGNGLAFAVLNYAPVNGKTVIQQARKGVQYLLMDLLAILSDQIATLICMQLLSRAELGVFGLCRQVLNAANTPGWSLMQANYPKLVETKLGNVNTLNRQILYLAALVSAGMMAGSAVLGYAVYKIPEFWLMCSVLALSLPARYLNNFYDQIIRSVGKVRSCNYLALSKLLFSLVMFPVFVSIWNLWGAILGLSTLGIVSAWLYRQIALPLFPQKIPEAVS